MLDLLEPADRAEERIPRPLPQRPCFKLGIGGFWRSQFCTEAARPKGFELLTPCVDGSELARTFLMFCRFRFQGARRAPTAALALRCLSAIEPLHDNPVLHAKTAF